MNILGVAATMLPPHLFSLALTAFFIYFVKSALRASAGWYNPEPAIGGKEVEMNLFKTIVAFVTFLVAVVFFTPAQAGEQERAVHCTAVSCGKLTRPGPAKCRLVTLRFRQPEPGLVTIVTWRKVGERWEKLREWRVKKPANAVFRTCEGNLARADKLTLCASSEGRIIASDAPIADVRATARHPLVLSQVPKVRE